MKMPLKTPFYIALPKVLHTWCETHKRVATHLLVREGMEATPNCDPAESGILAPCKCVRLMNQLYYLY